MTRIRKLAAGALALALLAVAAACGGQAATSTPAPATGASPPPAATSSAAAPTTPVETPGGATPAAPSLEAVLEEVSRLFEGGSLDTVDLVEAPLGGLGLPELEVVIPSGAASGLNADFGWQFEVPDLEVEPPAVSAADVVPDFNLPGIPNIPSGFGGFP